MLNLAPDSHVAGAFHLVVIGLLKFSRLNCSRMSDDYSGADARLRPVPAAVSAVLEVSRYK
jgi:hypothetical protein